MIRTCTLCNFTETRGSEYHWQSHLSTDEHRRNKIAHDREELLESLKWLLRAADSEPEMRIYGAHLDEARRVITQAEES